MINRENLIERLTEGFHKHERFARSSLFIYGSSNNGFGTDDSDIDLCLVDSTILINEIDRLAESVTSILQEMKLTEIASVLGIGLPLVKYRLKQARNRLQVLLGKEETVNESG